MSAGVCGKRVGCEELFGSSPKRSRFSSFGASPDRPREFGAGSEDPVSSLLQMFPALDPEFISTVLRGHNNKIEEARESLSVLSSDFMERNRSASSDSAIIGNCIDVPTGGMSDCKLLVKASLDNFALKCLLYLLISLSPGLPISALILEICQPGSQPSKQDVQGVNNINQKFANRSVIDGPQWVDLFVREMMSVTSLDDARGRAAGILEAFERNITANTRAAKELELASLKENLQGLLNNNQILKKAVAIQHQRNLEQEVNEGEVRQLKLMLGQYQEQVRNLELSNYTLKLHLQRAQESSSLHGQFHPDIY